MILKGVFTQGKHTGKPVSSPDVSAAYLRMILWHGGFGSHVDDAIRVELNRRGEVHFDAVYNAEYRASRRQEKARERVQKAWREKANGEKKSNWYDAGSSRASSPTPLSLPVDKKLLAELVTAGRQALAKRHHPDVGGDVKKMQEINAAADALLEWVGK